MDYFRVSDLRYLHLAGLYALMVVFIGVLNHSCACNALIDIDKTRFHVPINRFCQIPQRGLVVALGRE